MRVNGPYVHTTGPCKGRAYVNIYDEDKRTTKLYSRFVMEQHLGRELSYDETVDHINEDKTDDRLENLQILSRSENSKKSSRLRRPPEMITFNCPFCGETATKLARYVKHCRNQGKSGPYCSKSCAGKAQHA